jgi:O-antigen/teichoic acid export membrane protein
MLSDATKRQRNEGGPKAGEFVGPFAEINGSNAPPASDPEGKDAPLTRRITTNAIWNFGGHVSQSLVALVCLPFLIEFFGLARVGLLSLIWVVVGYFSILDVGLGQSLTNAVARAIADGDRNRVARLYRAATRMQLGLGLTGGLLMALFARPLVVNVLSVPTELKTEALTSVYICALAFPFVLLTSSAIAMLQAAQRFDAINLVQGPLGIGQFVLPLVCVIWSRNLAVVVAVLVLSRVIALIVLIIRVRNLVSIGSSEGGSPPGELRALISFGGWVTISNIVSPLMVYADRFLIGSLRGLSSVAYYSVPSDATLRLLIVSRSMLSAMFPVMSATRDKELLRELVLRSVRYILLLVGIPSLIAFFAARELLNVWIGPSFAAESAVVLQILLPGIVANSIAGVPYTVIQATGRADLTAKLHVVEFFPYVLIAFFAIRAWGIQGAAFAWSLRTIADAAVLFYLARGCIAISRAHFVKHRIPQLLGILTLVGAASFAFHLFVGPVSSQWIASFCLTVIMIGLGWGLFLTQAERERLLSTVRQRLIRPAR